MPAGSCIVNNWQVGPDWLYLRLLQPNPMASQTALIAPSFSQFAAAKDWLIQQPEQLFMGLAYRLGLDTIQREAFYGRVIAWQETTPLTTWQEVQVVAACWDAGWTPTAGRLVSIDPVQVRVNLGELRHHPGLVAVMERRAVEEIARQLITKGLVRIEAEASRDFGDAQIRFTLNI